jgi:hypothetical protein
MNPLGNIVLVIILLELCFMAVSCVQWVCLFCNKTPPIPSKPGDDVVWIVCIFVLAYSLPLSFLLKP